MAQAARRRCHCRLRAARQCFGAVCMDHRRIKGTARHWFALPLVAHAAFSDDRRRGAQVAGQGEDARAPPGRRAPGACLLRPRGRPPGEDGLGAHRRRLRHGLRDRGAARRARPRAHPRGPGRRRCPGARDRPGMCAASSCSCLRSSMTGFGLRHSAAIARTTPPM